MPLPNCTSRGFSQVTHPLALLFGPRTLMIPTISYCLSFHSSPRSVPRTLQFFMMSHIILIRQGHQWLLVHAAYPLKVAKREFEHMLQLGIIRPSSSAWASPYGTQEGSRRLASLWRLPCIKPQHYPWPISNTPRTRLLSCPARRHLLYKVGLGVRLSSDTRQLKRHPQNCRHDSFRFIRVSTHAFWSAECSTDVPMFHGPGAQGSPIRVRVAISMMFWLPVPHQRNTSNISKQFSNVLRPTALLWIQTNVSLVWRSSTFSDITSTKRALLPSRARSRQSSISPNILLNDSCGVSLVLSIYTIASYHMVQSCYIPFTLYSIRNLYLKLKWGHHSSLPGDEGSLSQATTGSTTMAMNCFWFAPQPLTSQNSNYPKANHITLCVAGY